MYQYFIVVKNKSMYPVLPNQYTGLNSDIFGANKDLKLTLFATGSKSPPVHWGGWIPPPLWKSHLHPFFGQKNEIP